jgi:hypothetical protein
LRCGSSRRACLDRGLDGLHRGRRGSPRLRPRLRERNESLDVFGTKQVGQEGHQFERLCEAGTLASPGLCQQALEFQ